MKKNLGKGDEVAWASSQGKVEGTIEKKITKPIDIKGHHVAASPDHPEYVVRSAATGALAAHEPESLKKSR